MGDLGKRLRQAREDAGLSLTGLAARTGYSRSYLGNVETGVRDPTPRIIRAYERVLGVDRRALFAGIASAVAGTAMADLAVDVFRDIAAERSKLLSTVQTSHDTDRAIGTLVAKDTPCVASLSKWANKGSPVLRVNSLGILAKVGFSALDNDVIRALKADSEARELYLTAVTSRVLRLPWDEARGITVRSDPLIEPSQIDLFARELINRADSGARWCSLVMLASTRPSAPAAVDAALREAIKTESSLEMLRSLGSVLAGVNPVAI